MEKQKGTNACIRIGSIFRYHCADECGVSDAYYQVVGLRGKTLVELREIQTEEYVDGRCVNTLEEQRRFREENPGQECTPTVWSWLVWSRPLPGRFARNAEVFTVRALAREEGDSRSWLRGRGADNWNYYQEAGEDEESIMAGYDGGYARIALKKEGKLPSWAEVPHP